MLLGGKSDPAFTPACIPGRRTWTKGKNDDGELEDHSMRRDTVAYLLREPSIGNNEDGVSTYLKNHPKYHRQRGALDCQHRGRGNEKRGK